MPGALPPRGEVEWGGAAWLRRLRSNARPQQSSVVTTGLVGTHQLANDRRYASSRETDPLISGATLFAGVAGQVGMIGIASRRSTHAVLVRALVGGGATVSFIRGAAGAVIPAGLTDVFGSASVAKFVVDDGAADVLRVETGNAVLVAGAASYNPPSFLQSLNAQIQDVPYLARVEPGEEVVFQNVTVGGNGGWQFIIQAVLA